MTKAKPRTLAPSSAWVQRYLQEHKLSTLITDGINEVLFREVDCFPIFIPLISLRCRLSGGVRQILRHPLPPFSLVDRNETAKLLRCMHKKFTVTPWSSQPSNSRYRYLTSQKTPSLISRHLLQSYNAAYKDRIMTFFVEYIRFTSAH